MTVRDLNRNQLSELKANYLNEKNSSVYWSEICDADSLVSDEQVMNEYKDTEFSEDDFFN
jgi:hypothetical protein